MNDNKRTASLCRRILVAAISCLFLVGVIWIAEPASALRSLTRFPLHVLLVFFVLLGANLFVVSFRFWRVLTRLGIILPWSMALRASMAGHLSSLFFIPLIGQVAGRQVYLKKAGVPPVVNASVAACERTLLAVMSGLLASWGAVYLLGQEPVQTFVSRLALAQVALVAASGLTLSMVLGRKGSAFVQKHLNRKSIGIVLEIAAITLAGQLLMLSCFVLGFHTVAPKVGLLSLFAAAAVVSFAASLPISVGGWGVREMAAVFVLKLFGVPAADAIVVSILIGLCSTLVLLLAVPVLTRKTPDHATHFSPHPGNAVTADKVENVLTWMLGIIVAVFVFFQVHVPLAGSLVTLNLADPFAMLALAALGLQCLQARRLPHWRVERFNLILLAMSVLLVLGFLIGWARIGLTEWALGNRLIGWLVLLGYLSAGALLVARQGRHGMRRITETMACVVCVVIVCRVTLRLLTMKGWHFEGVDLGANFQGYSGNRNTFAFQLLCVTAMLTGYAHLYRRHWESSAPYVLLVLAQGIVLLALYLADSRAGQGTLIILFLMAPLLGMVGWRYVGLSLLTAAALWGFLAVLPYLHFPYMNPKALSAGLNGPETNIFEGLELVRWHANGVAWRMWLEHPLFGAGLGTFFAYSPAEFGMPVVIHSTPFWFLAEFGLVGVIVLGGSAWVLLRKAARTLRGLPAERALFLMLIAFAIFCQVHEILYQRIFWFLLGTLLALPGHDAENVQALAAVSGQCTTLEKIGRSRLLSGLLPGKPD